MDLISAIKSGKRFKRPLWDGYLTAEECSNMYLMRKRANVGDTFLYCKTADILADDWITEDPKPKRRLYISCGGILNVVDVGKPVNENWTPLSRKEFDALFEGDK